MADLNGITQDMIDRGDVVDPDLIAEWEAAQEEAEDSEDDEEVVETPEDEEELDDDKDEDKEEKDDDDDEGGGEREEEESLAEEEESEAQEGDDSKSELEEENDEGGGNRIPLSRLNEVLAQRDDERQRTKWLEEQLEKLIKQGELPPKDEEVEEPFDFVAAESEYIELILKGDTDKAAKLRAEMDSERIEGLREEISGVRDETENSITTRLEKEKFDLFVSNLENKHSFLNNESDDYNEEAVETINALMGSFTAKGDSGVQALDKAVKRVVPMYDRQSPVPKEKGKVDGERKKATRKKNVETMKNTPPKSRGRQRKDRDLSEINVKDLSDKEFRSLTKREEKELRGDVV